MIKFKEDLLTIRPFPQEQYESYPLTSLTAYCVYWLQEWSITTSYENVAVASHRMFPVKFSLVGWTEFPDITRTSRSILQMRPKWRNLATSSSGRGVFLNQKGIQEAQAVIARLGAPNVGDEPRSDLPTVEIRPEMGKRDRTVHPEKNLEAVRKSQLFEMYKNSRLDQAEAIDLVGMLNVYDHTPSTKKKGQLKQLLESARELGDQEVIEFLNQITRRFKNYLTR